MTSPATLIFITFLSSKVFMKFKNKNFYETILHLACRSGSLELVEYIISLRKIDVQSKTILILFIIKFQS